MPAIGPDTVAGAARAQLRGLALAAGRGSHRRARALHPRGRRGGPVHRRISGVSGRAGSPAAHRARRGRAFRRPARLQADARAPRGAHPAGVAFIGRRRRGDGGRGPEKPVSDQRHRGHGDLAGDRPPADAPRAHPARRPRRSSRNARTRSSSSTAPTSPIASRAGCARRCPICRSSTTSARPSGPGGRAGRRRCSAYVDCVLGLLPFEPEAYRPARRPALRLCRPSADRAARRAAAQRATRRAAATPSRRVLVVLPGSRRSEIRRLMADFGGALGALRDGDRAVRGRPADPAAYRGGGSRARAALWPVAPRIVLGEAAKYEAFRTARAALAASGTVTLELALAGVPAGRRLQGRDRRGAAQVS